MPLFAAQWLLEHWPELVPMIAHWLVYLLWPFFPSLKGPWKCISFFKAPGFGWHHCCCCPLVPRPSFVCCEIKWAFILVMDMSDSYVYGTYHPCLQIFAFQTFISMCHSNILPLIELPRRQSLNSNSQTNHMLLLHPFLCNITRSFHKLCYLWIFQLTHDETKVVDWLIVPSTDVV